MKDLFDISKFDLYKEDNRREVKKANGGLPASLWETYFAFANCYGGVIILGVAENKDGSWHTTGLSVTDKGKLLKQFWDTVNNRKKVNGNIFFPDYFLDYRENFGAVMRWTDRLQSSSGEWSGNIFDFYFRVYNKIIQDIKVPFKMEHGFRLDDTPVHKALREALANCVINDDFYGKFGIIIKKESDKITLENPGYIRQGKEQMRRGGLSDPRKKNIMKMFNMIDIGERSGSGVPNIFNTWEDEGWKEPVIEEYFDPDRTILTLEFVEKQAKKNKRSKER